MKNSLPKISIITPSFNQAQYVEQTICSVLEQGYSNLEYIVADGGSTDGTLEILKKYDRHLTWWCSEKDHGQTHAINKGMTHATGDVLAYINSDDWYLPGTLAAVGEHFTAHSGARILHGRCVITDQQGGRLADQLANIQTVEDVLNLWGVWWNYRNFVQPEVFWSREVARRVGLFDERLYFVMDYHYWLRALVAGATVDPMDREFSCFRRHDAQKTSQEAKCNTELRERVRQALWDKSVPLDSAARQRLQLKWLAEGPVRDFCALADQTAIQRDPSLLRWGKLLGFVAQHPQVLRVPAMRERLGRFVTGG